MNRIIFPLKMGMNGQAVADLQDSLRLLLEKGIIPMDDADRQAFAERLQAERAEQRYDEGSAKLVVLFQEQQHLPTNGDVDEATAKALNDAIAALQLQQRIVQGQVRTTDGRPVIGVVVRAYNKGLRNEALLGETLTAREGHYRITYEITGDEVAAISLLVRVVDRNQENPVLSPIRFNTHMTESVDFSVSNDYGGLSEVEQLLQAIKPLLGDLRLTQLREDDEQQEISYLAGRSGVDRQQLQALVQAAQLAEETALPIEALYSLARQNHATTLASLLALRPEALRQTLDSAIRQNIIPIVSLPDETLQRQLDEQLIKQTFKQPAEAGRLAMGDLVATVLPAGEKQRAFLLAYARHQGSVDEFLTEHDLQAYVDGPEQANALKFTLEIGTLTQNNRALVEQLQHKQPAGAVNSLRDLAAYGAHEWEDLIGAAADIATPAEEALRLAQTIENKFPTEVIAHRLLRAEESPTEPLRLFFANFLESEISFDLCTTHLHDFVQKHPILLKDVAPEEHKSVIEQLKPIQRVRKLTANAAQMDRLRAAGIHSAAQIARMGRNAFVQLYADVREMDAAAAALIHEKAQHTTAVALNLLAEYHAAFNSTQMAALPNPLRKIEIPDLEVLFGSFDLCDCAECRTVLSPAAYLTDILHFLADCKTLDANGNIIANTSPPQTLLDRRPDLAEIELTCPNTNVPLPYIDLVNEVLEDAIAPRKFEIIPWAELWTELNNRILSPRLRQAFALAGFPLTADALILALQPKDPANEWRISDKGWHFNFNFKMQRQNASVTVRAWPQTGGSAQDLSAHPEHNHAPAYAKLRKEIYPWNLPLDLPWEEVRSYLGQLGVTRQNLLQAFHKPGTTTTASALAAEALALSTVEWQIITGDLQALGRTTSELWGCPKTLSDGWIAEISPVRSFLGRTGLTYQELTDLLTLRYINHYRTLAIDVNQEIKDSARNNQDPTLLATCDTTKLRVTGLTQENLRRIHGFVRLWRKLGWTMREVDQAICALSTVQIVDNEQFVDSKQYLVEARSAIDDLLNRQPSAPGTFVKLAQLLGNAIGLWVANQKQRLGEGALGQVPVVRQLTSALLEREVPVGDDDRVELRQQLDHLTDIGKNIAAQHLALHSRVDEWDLERTTVIDLLNLPGLDPRNVGQELIDGLLFLLESPKADPPDGDFLSTRLRNIPDIQTRLEELITTTMSYVQQDLMAVRDALLKFKKATAYLLAMISGKGVVDEWNLRRNAVLDLLHTAPDLDPLYVGSELISNLEDLLKSTADAYSPDIDFLAERLVQIPEIQKTLDGLLATIIKPSVQASVMAVREALQEFNKVTSDLFEMSVRQRLFEEINALCASCAQVLNQHNQRAVFTVIDQAHQVAASTIIERWKSLCPPGDETPSALLSTINSLVQTLRTLLENAGSSEASTKNLLVLEQSLAIRPTVAAIGRLAYLLREQVGCFAELAQSVRADDELMPRFASALAALAQEIATQFKQQGLDLDLFINLSTLAGLISEMTDKEITLASIARVLPILRTLAMTNLEENKTWHDVDVAQLPELVGEAQDLSEVLLETFAAVGLDEEGVNQLGELQRMLTQQLQVDAPAQPLTVIMHEERLVSALCEKLQGKIVVHEWLVPVLNNMLRKVLNNTVINSDLLVKVAQVQEFHTNYKLPVPQILAWYAPLDTYRYPGDEGAQMPSLYEQLFQNPTSRQRDPQTATLFRLNTLQTEVKNADRLLSEAAIRAAVTASLRISTTELGLLLEGRTLHLAEQEVVVIPPIVSADKRLTLANLSQLFRYASLARALKLSLSDLLRIQALSGIDPFTEKNDSRSAQLTFRAALEQIRGSGFALDELEYLLRNLQSATAPTAENIVPVLERLRTGLQQIAADTAFVADPDGEITRRHLSTLFDRATVDEVIRWLAWDQNRLNQVLAEFEQRTFETAVPIHASFKSPPDLVHPVVYDETQKKLRIVGVMTPAEKTILQQQAHDDSERAAIALLFDAPRTLAQLRLQELGAPVAVAALDTLPPTLSWPDSLKHRIRYDATKHLLSLVGAMSKEEQTQLNALSATSNYQTAIETLFQQPRRFVVGNLRAFEMPTFKSSLPQLVQGLTFPAAIKTRVYYNPTDKQLCFIGIMTEPDRTTLLDLVKESPEPDKSAYTVAIKELYDQSSAIVGNPESFSPLPKNEFLNSQDGQALFDSAATEAAQRFASVLQKSLAYARRLASTTLVIQTLAETLKLEVTVAGEVLTQWIVCPDDSKQPALQVFLQSAFASSDPHVKVSESLFGQQFNTFRLLHKVALVLNKFKVTPEQLSWLTTLALKVGWLNLNELPAGPALVVRAGASQAQFAAWARLVDLFHLRDTLPDGSAILGESFVRAHDAKPETQETQETFLRWLSDHTGWNLTDLEFLSANQQLGFSFPLAYQDERALEQLKGCFDLSKRLGVSVVQCWAWANANLTQADAQAAWQMLKARYGEAWAEVLKPLADALRERRRSALVAYLVAHAQDCFGQTMQDAKDLYAYLLIDVEMSAVVPTSRIKQACASVQLFVQRCLMNLEADVIANAEKDDKWLQWEWMKNYRVWEANRKVFLYPENWIEPELRDDKSPFFKELENELMQNEISKATAEDALKHYLEKLDQVARLEIMGMYHQVEAPSIDILHVIGRTSNTPHIYFYRRRIDSSYWTAWEKVDVDIEGDHLRLVVWNRRVCIFWLTFREHTEEQPLRLDSGVTMSLPEKQWKIKLAWSEYKSGKWSSKRISKDEVSDWSRKYIRLDGNVGLAERSKDAFSLLAFGEDSNYLFVGADTPMLFQFSDVNSHAELISRNNAQSIIGAKGTSTPWCFVDVKPRFNSYICLCKNEQLQIDEYGSQPIRIGD